jgi:hypothetical protein
MNPEGLELRWIRLAASEDVPAAERGLSLDS